MKKILSILLLSVVFIGCGAKTPSDGNTESRDYNVTVTRESDVLYNGALQKKLVWDTCKVVFDNQKYRYDSEIDRDGDQWDTLMYKAILQRDEAAKSGKVLPYVLGDCEDTMWANARILELKGFPKEQMFLVYCTVPADQAGNRGGHAILVVLIDGMIPYVVEQLPEPRPLQDLILFSDYNIVAFMRYDEDIVSGWNFATESFTDRAGWIYQRKQWERK